MTIGHLYGDQKKGGKGKFWLGSDLALLLGLDYRFETGGQWHASILRGMSLYIIFRGKYTHEQTDMVSRLCRLCGALATYFGIASFCAP